MKRYIYLFLITLALSGCSVFNGSSTNTSLKDQRLATDFTDEGIKLFYTMGGKLEKIEVYGQADAWKGNVEILAEADAYAKLVKFIHGSQVKSDRTVRLLGRAIEKAEDASVSRTGNADAAIVFTARDLDIDERGTRAGPEQSKSAQRSARALNETLVDTVAHITSKGRLTGVRKIRDSQTNNGRTYVAVYQWSDQDQTTVDAVRARMNGKE